MVNDLIDKRSAKQKLYEWLWKKKHALSHEIIEWGSRNNCNWPMTRLNELKREGKVRRMADEKRISYFGNGREAAWEIIRFPEVGL